MPNRLVKLETVQLRGHRYVVTYWRTPSHAWVAKWSGLEIEGASFDDVHAQITRRLTQGPSLHVVAWPPKDD